MKKFNQLALIFCTISVIVMLAVNKETVYASTTSTGTVTIGPGSLKLSKVDLALNFNDESPIFQSKSKQSRTKSGKVIVSDTRSGYAGWHVQIKREDSKNWSKDLSIFFQEGDQANVEISASGFKNFLNQPENEAYETFETRNIVSTLEIEKGIESGEYQTTIVWNLQSGPEN